MAVRGKLGCGMKAIKKEEEEGGRGGGVRDEKIECEKKDWRWEWMEGRNGGYRHLREWKRKMVEDVGEFGEIEKKGNDGERWRE